MNTTERTPLMNTEVRIGGLKYDIQSLARRLSKTDPLRYPSKYAKMIGMLQERKSQLASEQELRLLQLED